MTGELLLPAALAGAFLLLGLVVGVLIQARWNRQSQNEWQSEKATLDTQLTELQQLREREQRDLAVAQTQQQQDSEALARSREAEKEAAEKLSALREQLARQESDYRHLKQSTDEQITLLSDAKKQLTEQFESLANRIFDEKSQRLQQSSRSALETSLQPFKEQLKAFRERVDHIYDTENRQRGELREQLKSLQEMNHSISREAQNLTRALKGDNKAQGNWGEVILERVLEESGLRKGHEYETQVSFTDDSGRRRQPDVIVRLPDNKDIVIDAKVSLVAYERYCSAELDSDRQLALREHIQSIKNHVSGLSTKAYQHIEEIRSLDFVFIFIPVEAAFMAAFEHDPDVFRQAYEQNIIVVGPTTLLATLRTVQSIWRYERQNQNAEKIAKEAGGLHDQFALVLESLEDIGKHLGRSRDAYEKTLDRLTRGRGNLVGRVGRLEALGAKVKKTLPQRLAERADLESDLSDIDEDDQSS